MKVIQPHPNLPVKSAKAEPDMTPKDDPRAPETSFDNLDERVAPPPPETGFDIILDRALSRRGMMCGALRFGLGSFLLGTAGLLRPALALEGRFGFAPVAASSSDALRVPEGFEARVLLAWGDPVLPGGEPFDAATRGTAESQARAMGDNCDGMEIFQRGGRTVLAVNNEYTNRAVLWGNRAEGRPEGAEDIEKGMMAHGVTLVEIAPGAEGWRVVADSPLNRRITPRTPMRLSGPAAGDALLRTSSDPEGIASLGTWNNCGSGRTPWGTLLTCEENFNGYFTPSDPAATDDPALRRYGIGARDYGYGWAGIEPRFDPSLEPNEPNRAGYVVEIDPFDPASVPVKRTALGRFKHENAEVVLAADGRVVVYMGDDERGEFLYRFVSAGVFVPEGEPVRLLDAGQLAVAVFEDDGTGTWLDLTPEATGMSAAQIAVHTRIAASRVGATTMDRPEWVAAHPDRAEVYVALTNNRERGVAPNAGGDAQPVNGPNPRAENRYGQILRWRPHGGDHAAARFEWDLYALAGNPAVHADAHAGSPNIDAANMFNSPDGLRFDRFGRLWIQTDGNDSNAGDFAGMGNNQMLVGDPLTGEIRRFLTGPVGCEVTGLAFAPDGRTLFVGIQHPGPEGASRWPDGGEGPPRAAVVAVRRSDGGVIG